MIQTEIKALKTMTVEEIARKADEYRVPAELVSQVQHEGKLPVVMFVAGGIATPADAALMMQMGAEGVFVGSGIFKSENPVKMAKAIVEATLHYNDPAKIAEVSTDLGMPMESLEISKLETRLADRGW
jgi:pyridoxal 5'-phosphate synthase pdxS subunit